MLTTLRAAISVLMLLGFYVLALGIVGGLGYASYWLWQEHAGSGAAKLSYVTIAVGAGIALALWRVVRAKPGHPDGVRLAPEQAPDLWATVRELAAEAKTRAPDEITIVAEVNAAVSEDSKLMGFVGGRRRLYLGLPLMQALSVAQVRSVLAHELGHYSHSHTRMSAVAYRGRLAMIATSQQLAGRFTGWVFRIYTRLYLLVEAAVSRRQELEADRASVRMAGREVAQSALRELPVVDAAWGFYMQRYIKPGWEAGYAPRDIFGGFGQMLTARTDELTRLRTTPPPRERSGWDSHPPIGVRIAAMQAMSGPTGPVDTRAAVALLPDVDQLGQLLAREAVALDGREQLDWDALAARWAPADEQRVADQLYRSAARLNGGRTGDLSMVLRLVEAGRLGELADQVMPPDAEQDAAARFAPGMELLLRVAAVRSGTATFRHDWTSGPVLIRTDGTRLDLEPVAQLACSPQTLPEAMRQLAALGIDVTRATQVNETATAHDGEIMGGLANAKVDDAQHDILILDVGLIMRPCPKKTDGGKNRLIEFAESGPVLELAKRHTFLPYDEIAGAVVEKETPVRVRLTLHDGRSVSIHETWSGDRLTKDSAQTLVAAVRTYATEPVQT